MTDRTKELEDEIRTDNEYTDGFEDGIKIGYNKALEEVKILLQDLHDDENSIFGSEEFYFLKEQLTELKEKK